MLKAGKGSVVQFGSVAATNPAWGESYGIVKASQMALAYQCAMEYGPTIHSNAVLCGWIQDSPASRLLQTIPKLSDPSAVTSFPYLTLTSGLLLRLPNRGHDSICQTRGCTMEPQRIAVDAGLVRRT